MEDDYRQAPPKSLRERVKDDLRISDLELTDRYNQIYGTRYSSPLKEAKVKEFANDILQMR